MKQSDKIKHQEMAKAELEKFQAAGAIVHREFLGGDGWGDTGFVHAIVELPSNEIVKLKWHSGAEKFFKQHISGGSTPYTVEDMFPKKAIVVTTEGHFEVPVKELEEELAKRGFTKKGTCTHSNPYLRGNPEFEGLCGPMKDGERIRYEDWETYRIMSA